MSSRDRGVGGRHHRAGAMSAPTPTPSSSSATRGGKITQRRSASRDLLEKLRDPNTLRRLEAEAERGFRNAARGGGGGRGGDPCNATLPRERVCALYRSLEGGDPTSSSSSRRRNHANHTGLTKRSCKFNLDDVLRRRVRRGHDVPVRPPPRRRDGPHGAIIVVVALRRQGRPQQPAASRTVHGTPPPATDPTNTRTPTAAPASPPGK